MFGSGLDIGIIATLGGERPPFGQQFLTETDTNNFEQFITVTDTNGVEQRITVATGLS